MNEVLTMCSYEAFFHKLYWAHRNMGVSVFEGTH